MKFSVSDTDVMLMSNGLVRWVVPVFVKTSCLLNVKLFPFDSQLCSIDLSSSLIRTARERSLVDFIYDERLPRFMEKKQELQVNELITSLPNYIQQLEQ